MSRPTEQSEGADSIPKPELNPLLNPLLADNMGRWAEVYFTSPPEKREEAIIELLHTLENEKAAGDSLTVEPRNNVSRPIPPAPSFHLENERTITYCRACGHENPATHQFCGMCGSKLEETTTRQDPHRELHPVPPEAAIAARDHEENAPNRGNEHLEFESDAPEHAAYDDASYEFEQGDPRAEHVASGQPTYAGNDLSLFQSFRTSDSEGDYEFEEPPSNPYRYYIAAVLALVILVLGYMAWRGTQGQPAAHEASPAPPAPVEQNTPPPATPPSHAADEAQPSDTQKAPGHAAKAAPDKPTPQPRRTEVARTTTTPEPATSAEPSTDFGAEELAMAHRYLDGSGGRGRDSAEAAKWLWKSMAKHNGEAALLLADLYLKGDGVSKNCDQGRVLLDSAARRGISGAGERLRNLQAFGCH